MKRTVILIVCLVYLVGFAAQASAAPRVSLPAARKIALARVPGTVEHEKLKHKHAAVYSFKIQPRGAGPKDPWQKVEVDADSGQIVEVKAIKPSAGDD